MQPTARHRPAPLLAHDWPECPGPAGLCPLEATVLLREVLAAARDTVARCDRALRLLAECQVRAPHESAANTHPDAIAVAFSPPSLTRSSNGHASPTGAGTGISDLAPGRLSTRELEVVGLLATGLSNKEIAGTLGVSVRTIERHISNAYRKLGARGRADATAWVVRQRLI